MSGVAQSLMGARRARAALFAGAALLVATALPAQLTPRWEVRSDAFADAWFFGLSLVGEQGPGPLPMYAARGIRWTASARLADAAARLRSAFTRDSTLELLHFIPLHMVGVEPLAGLNAIRAALLGAPTLARSPARADQVAAAVAANLSQRAHPVAAAFAEALAEDWKGGLRSAWNADEASRVASHRALQRRWETVFAPVLRPFLTGHAPHGALVIVSPSVGAEGRVLREHVSVPLLAIVGSAFGADADGPLLALTRELTFPVVDAALHRSPGAVPSEPVAAARLSHTMAVRAGAMLLANDSLLAPKYDAFFAGAAGHGGRRLRDAFPLDSALERGLRAELLARLVAKRQR